ncbi:uncharacterized protein LOC142983008 [Anticarsia gemmatalis]|uniref:uncharacterized protein LOC142983008 n=1 Tax=Anticarsia gemmatalis TaxID=129554 RepID=UPI003F776198
MRAVCVIVFVCVCAAGAITGRGFFCRDPDTGKLHAVNTTWPSSSFCGNYHCRLRRKNLTETEYAPLRQIYVPNITVQIDPAKQNVTKKTVTTERTVENEILRNINQLMDFNIFNSTQEATVLKPVEKKDSDRYLTDFEIKTISTLLHAVKRSDLDAILEIYRLAQDIYKDIDKSNADTLIHETINDMRKGQVDIPKEKSKIDTTKGYWRKHGVSYWYDPVAYGKPKPFDVNLRPDQNALGSEIVKKTTPRPTKPTTTPRTSTNAPKTLNTYFRGALTTKDFRKLPYYYPISDFQRMASYYHQAGAPKFIYPVTTKPPSKHTTAVLPVILTLALSKVPEVKTDSPMYRSEIKPSVLLPYPFSYITHNYNWTFPENTYSNKNKLDRYKPEKKKEKKKAPVAVLMNPDLENFEELGPAPKPEKNIAKKDQKVESKFKHDWQTEQISRQILEEVRANFAERAKFLKPYPLRKKVKLERVGKLFKLDEHKRSKREVEPKEDTGPELFEVYVERTTCHSDDSIPGFFRYGNMSQPFPECCPQRISS